MQLVFECVTTKAPKKGTIHIQAEWPNNLAEMLTMIRKMGYRPEDIAIRNIEFNSDYGQSVWTVR